MHRYTPPSRIWGPVTFMWLMVVPSDMVYWLVRWLPSRTMGSSSKAQVTVGGGAPLAAHISENCSPGLTTFSLKDETMRGVPSAGSEEPPSGSPSHRETIPPRLTHSVRGRWQSGSQDTDRGLSREGPSLPGSEVLASAVSWSRFLYWWVVRITEMAITPISSGHREDN